MSTSSPKSFRSRMGGVMRRTSSVLALANAPDPVTPVSDLERVGRSITRPRSAGSFLPPRRSSLSRSLDGHKSSSSLDLPIPPPEEPTPARNPLLDAQFPLTPVDVTLKADHNHKVTPGGTVASALDAAGPNLKSDSKNLPRAIAGAAVDQDQEQEQRREAELMSVSDPVWFGPEHMDGHHQEPEQRQDEEQDPFADPPARVGMPTPSPQREDYAASTGPVAVIDGRIDRARDTRISMPIPVRSLGPILRVDTYSDEHAPLLSGQSTPSYDGETQHNGHTLLRITHTTAAALASLLLLGVPSLFSHRVGANPPDTAATPHALLPLLASALVSLLAAGLLTAVTTLLAFPGLGSAAQRAALAAGALAASAMVAGPVVILQNNVRTVGSRLSTRSAVAALPLVLFIYALTAFGVAVGMYAGF